VRGRRRPARRGVGEARACVSLTALPTPRRECGLCAHPTRSRTRTVLLQRIHLLQRLHEAPVWPHQLLPLLCEQGTAPQSRPAAAAGATPPATHPGRWCAARGTRRAAGGARQWTGPASASAHPPLPRAPWNSGERGGVHASRDAVPFTVSPRARSVELRPRDLDKRTKLFHTDCALAFCVLLGVVRLARLGAGKTRLAVAVVETSRS